MTFRKANRLPVLAAALCVLLMGFAGASYGAVRFDVIASPTEVINTGLSEVTGSINLVVNGIGNVTGNSQGGPAQIGIIYNSNGTYMPIDNTTSTGIKIFFTSGFNSANPTVITVFNATVAGKCSGQMTINLLPGATPTEINAFGADFIRVEGVRGRIANSSAGSSGNDLYADLQSINDPAANSFTQPTVRVAKSLPGMVVDVKPDTLLLCFPTLGKPPNAAAPTYGIVITEGFARAFVDLNAGAVGGTVAGTALIDRVDSGGQTNPQVYVPGPALSPGAGALGLPNNSTEVRVFMYNIPASVGSIVWADSTTNGTSYLRYLGDWTTDGAGNGSATYAFETTDQTGYSDITLESFTITPTIVLAASATATGTVTTNVSLAPYGGSGGSSTSSCAAPKASASDVQPRFYQVTQAQPSFIPIAGANDPDRPYSQIIRCNCYMLFTYVTSANGYNTGIVVANTSQDLEVFDPTKKLGYVPAPQIGKITFYFYSASQGFRGFFTTGDISNGKSYVALLSQMLGQPDASGSVNMPDTTFSGYIIARAEFQFCHAISYIADQNFQVSAQGFPALIIPDPVIKGRISASKFARAAADSGDLVNLPAGEGLNN